ncbi:hypothetical protein BJX61DRAFT_184517 [Aspergillus egyptiacus]|nr:hypothetical protein BJX61DRAFT_184517 [Aspergillus egyptiacus]
MIATRLGHSVVSFMVCVAGTVMRCWRCLRRLGKWTGGAWVTPLVSCTGSDLCILAYTYLSDQQGNYILPIDKESNQVAVSVSQNHLYRLSKVLSSIATGR